MDEYGWVKPVIAKHGEEEKVLRPRRALDPAMSG
jgi:hypothetical protein